NFDGDWTCLSDKADCAFRRLRSALPFDETVPPLSMNACRPAELVCSRWIKMIGRLIMKRLLSAVAMLAIALAIEPLRAKPQPLPPCGLQPTKERMKCLNDKLQEAQTKIGELQKDDADVRKEFDAKLKQAIEDMKAKLEREIADRKQADIDIKADLGREISDR